MTRLFYRNMLKLSIIVCAFVLIGASLYNRYLLSDSLYTTTGDVYSCERHKQNATLRYRYIVNGQEYQGSYMCDNCYRRCQQIEDMEEVKIKYAASDPSVSAIDDPRINW